MSKISSIFKDRKTLVTFIMAGDPSLAVTEKSVYELERSGADIIEIGIPFSDSVADGPVIVNAAQRAIKKGVSAKDCIKLVRKLRKKTAVPIVFMTSYNIPFSYGTEKFLKDCSKAGVDGLILPDLPYDEAKTVSVSAKKNGIDLIFLIAPNTPETRAKKLTKLSQGFIYLISLTGVTGVRASLSSSIGENVKRVKKYTNKPIAVGFGISTPDQAKQAAKFADGVIVGSAIVKRIAEGTPVGNFVKGLKNIIRKG
ncbi:MAG: tryptophan synthase subunit alpha [Candidatus Margulisiibacteriota bacterium]